MSLIGTCPNCGYEGFLEVAPDHDLYNDDECPDCGERFSAGGSSE